MWALGSRSMGRSRSRGSRCFLLLCHCMRAARAQRRKNAPKLNLKKTKNTHFQTQIFTRKGVKFARSTRRRENITIVTVFGRIAFYFFTFSQCFFSDFYERFIKMQSVLPHSPQKQILTNTTHPTTVPRLFNDRQHGPAATTAAGSGHRLD